MEGRRVVAVAAGAILVGAMVVGPVLASGAPSLPKAAQKLDGKQITALYDGAKFKFKDFRSEIPNTGTVKFDIKNSVRSGKLDGYGDTLGSVKIDGDTICSQGGGFDLCLNVYVDGANIYEVDSQGIVISVLQKQ